MECLLYIGKNHELPWALFCPSQNKVFFAKQVRSSVPSDTVSDCRNYLYERFGVTTENYPDSPFVPRHVVRFYGQVKFDGDTINIAPETKLL